jgi:hypothetical protein
MTAPDALLVHGPAPRPAIRQQRAAANPVGGRVNNGTITSIRIENVDEFKRLLESLALEFVDANIYLGLHNDLGSATTTRPGPLHRKGDARSQKLKVVCKACNSGWMSELQDRTKPVLLPLLTRQRKATRRGGISTLLQFG